VELAEEGMGKLATVGVVWGHPVAMGQENRFSVFS